MLPKELSPCHHVTMVSQTPVPVELIRDASAALARTVDGLDAQQWREASLLPGWTRAHVVAHLALNAEGLERAVSGVHTGRARPMYDSPEARDADIEDLAGESPSVLRERLLAGSECLHRALESLTDTDRADTFERTPGGQAIHVGAVPLMRLREVEVHHVDLDAAYSPVDWGEAFRRALIASMAKRPYAEPFRVVAEDLATAWDLGDPDGPGDRPVVSGDSADLGWWLTGRGEGAGLVSDTGALPRIEPW